MKITYKNKDIYNRLTNNIVQMIALEQQTHEGLDDFEKLGKKINTVFENLSQSPNNVKCIYPVLINRNNPYSKTSGAYLEKVDLDTMAKANQDREHTNREYLSAIVCTDPYIRNTPTQTRSGDKVVHTSIGAYAKIYKVIVDPDADQHYRAVENRKLSDDKLKSLGIKTEFAITLVHEFTVTRDGNVNGTSFLRTVSTNTYSNKPETKMEKLPELLLTTYTK